MAMQELCELWLRPADEVLCFRYHGALDISTEYPTELLPQRWRERHQQLDAKHFLALNLMTERHRLDARLAHTILAYWLLDGPSCPPPAMTNITSLNAARAGEFASRPGDDERLYYVVENDRQGQLAVRLDVSFSHAVAIERFACGYLQRHKRRQR